MAFAHQLERELQQAQEKNLQLTKSFEQSQQARQGWLGEFDRLKSELERAVNEIARLNGQTNFVCECGGTKVELQQVREELAKVKQQLKKFGSGVDFFSWGKVKAHLPVPLAKELTRLQCETDKILYSKPA